MSAGTERASWRDGRSQGSGAAVRRAPSRPGASASRFDASYYRRFYGDCATRVHGAREIGHLARGVSGFAEWLGVELWSVLDVGAGTGLWRDWFRRHRPEVGYRSIDVSPHACRVHGHERRDISAWRTARRFDLIVCHGVLQYLDGEAAERAIDNMGAMCRGLLYLEAVTREDAGILDTEATDMSIHLRPAAWYRARLARHFVQVGAGLWASTRSGIQLYALEAVRGAAGGAGVLRPEVTRPAPVATSRGRRRRRRSARRSSRTR